MLALLALSAATGLRQLARLDISAQLTRLIHTLTLLNQVISSLQEPQEPLYLPAPMAIIAQEQLELRQRVLQVPTKTLVVPQTHSTLMLSHVSQMMLALAALLASIVQKHQRPTLTQSLANQALLMREILAKTKTTAPIAQQVNSVLQVQQQPPDLAQMDHTAQLAQSSIRSMDAQQAKPLSEQAARLMRQLALTAQQEISAVKEKLS